MAFECCCCISMFLAAVVIFALFEWAYRTGGNRINGMNAEEWQAYQKRKEELRKMEKF